MPLLVEPSPPSPAARLGAPDEAQDASYFAASERMARRAANFGSRAASWCGFVPYMFQCCADAMVALKEQKAALARRFSTGLGKTL
jgi:hypothetical protein